MCIRDRNVPAWTPGPDDPTPAPTLRPAAPGDCPATGSHRHSRNMTKDWPVKSHTPLLLLAMLADDHSAGVEFYKQRQFSKTIEALERAVATEKLGTPEYRESAVILGQSYYLSARLPEAAAWLQKAVDDGCLLYTSPSPRDRTRSRM